MYDNFGFRVIERSTNYEEISSIVNRDKTFGIK